ncbi:patatin-like phospholipase family protein [Amphritea sp. 2_MG-2023]|uniref:patatin-like phospholipase family protein n=1 Tax=Amphritea TaxID=515417 RepID=UPI001C076ECA|nr:MULTISPECIES: patatin-like phospholipase family protein [Amphritea]MBU2964029.1 patatin-like phospholipase family protein [Amphritea atlantica]MDO6418429.1 patatin-like phospholipase family protein [Amphritea sp. 2_MG-2023]
MKVGLVLSGGGAKGAYQAGIIEAFAEYNLEVTMISGASIGALNGALVSASGNIAIAAERLAIVWDLIATKDILKINSELYPRYLTMLAAAGLTGVGQLGLGLLAGWAEGSKADIGFVDTSPLTDVLNHYINPQELSQGTPLYVALYPYRGRLHAIKEFITGEVMKRFDTQNSVFKHVQSLSFEEQKEALLASAAIPVLFSPRKVGGRLYSDGGQGNYKKAQGNTPITPLLDQGLDVILVSHLENGSLWNIDDFPNENIIELRPSKKIAEKGIRDTLGFDAGSITRWRAQGKADTVQLLEKLVRFARNRTHLIESRTVLQDKVGLSNGSLQSRSLEQTMAKLKKKE